MELNAANLTALFQAVKTNYLKGRKRALRKHEVLSSIIPSSTGGEILPINLMTGKMREWIGPRLVNHLNNLLLPVLNKPYEYTVAIPRDRVDDDQYGIYSGVMSEQAGYAAEQLWDDLLFGAMIANANWVDGKPFFAADRVYGKNTIKNYVTDALTPASYDAARLTMRSYLDPDGNPLQVNPDTLVVGPKLETMGKKILENEYWYDGTDKVQVQNPYKGTAKLEVCPALVGDADDYWFLLANGEPMRAFAVIKRKDGEMVRQDRPTDECAFTNGELLYGANSRGAACGVLPHLAYHGRV